MKFCQVAYKISNAGINVCQILNKLNQTIAQKLKIFAKVAKSGHTGALDPLVLKDESHLFYFQTGFLVRVWLCHFLC